MGPYQKKEDEEEEDEEDDEGEEEEIVNVCMSTLYGCSLKAQPRKNRQKCPSSILSLERVGLHTLQNDAWKPGF